jgi:hypothetical protein
MFTKSKIQQILESREHINNFSESLSYIMEKYNIEDSIFIYSNGSAKEVTKGYFEVICEYNSIKEAAKDIDLNTMGIRIINNDKFQLGNVKKLISECDREKTIMDINKYVVC